MKTTRITVAGWAVVTVAAAATVAGCADKYGVTSPTVLTTSSSTPTWSTNTVPSAVPGQPSDYSSLLIKPSDVGGDFTSPQAPVLNPNNAAGVAQLFVSADNSRRIGDTILIVADAAAAEAGLDNTQTNYGGKVNGSWQQVNIGSNGSMITGTSPDNSQAVTVILFTEGKALVDLEFDSAPNDPIDKDVATDIGHKQDAAIKSGLPR